MKARFVSESISFHRGKDPKEAMDIGIIKPMLIDAFQQSTHYDLNKLDWDYTEDYIGKNKIYIISWKTYGETFYQAFIPYDIIGGTISKTPRAAKMKLKKRMLSNQEYTGVKKWIP